MSFRPDIPVHVLLTEYKWYTLQRVFESFSGDYRARREVYDDLIDLGLITEMEADPGFYLPRFNITRLGMRVLKDRPDWLRGGAGRRPRCTG